VTIDPKKMFAPGQRQCAAFLLNQIHWGWCCWRADDQGYIRLKREYLEKVIPRPTLTAVRERLVGKGVIHLDRFWTPGKRSMGYRLAPEHRATRRVPCTDPALARRIQEVYAAESVPQIPVHRWLEAKLALFDFDLAQAVGIVAKMEPDADSKSTPEDYREQLRETCKRIEGGDRWLVVDRFGRVHTPITSLAKKLRCCLSVNGERLVNIDLANSQPLIAGLVAREYHRSWNKAMRLRDRRFSPHGKPYHCRGMEAVEPDAGRPDLERYIELCESGKLYESLGDDRERAKRRFLTTLYDKNRPRTAIDDLCPSLAAMLRKLKARDYRHASHVMQNAEATLFIHDACGRIMRERPELPVFTIHDSILTVPSAVEHVRTVVLDEFARLGVRPKLRIEEN
jgi:hypothetical protein